MPAILTDVMPRSASRDEVEPDFDLDVPDSLHEINACFTSLHCYEDTAECIDTYPSQA
jgi:hypothetical protein